MNIRQYLSQVPDVTWTHIKSEWPNDRVIIGPFTTPKLDKQRDRVLFTSSRLDYVFKFGHLIWEHHSDPKEPVIVLGDCLAIGFDKSGKTYGAWGVADGSETIDQHWNEIVKSGKAGGFSIGGKIPRGSRLCTGNECILTDPEVLEVSYTKSPAQDEAIVYWVNKFAKNVFKSAEQGVDTFELKTAMKKFDSRLEELYSNLPEENTDFERFVKYPCVMDIQSGLGELGMKKDEIRLIIEDHVESVKKKYVGVDAVDEPEKVTKEEMAPAPTPQVSDQGNETLQLLRGILDKLDAILSVQKPTMPGAEEADGAEPPAEPPAPEENPEPSEEAPPKAGGEEEEKEPEDKKEDKAEKAMDAEPEMGSAPSGGGESVPGEAAEPEMGSAPSGGSDIPSPDPEVEGAVGGMDLGEGEASVPTTPPQIPTQDQAIKGLVRAKADKIEDIFRKHGIVRLEVPELRPKVEKVDRITGMPLKKEADKNDNSIIKFFENPDNKIIVRRNK